MKYTILIFIVIASRLSFGQSTDSTFHPPVVEDKVFQVVEQMPEFPGGETAMMRFIQSRLVYPDSAREYNIQGRVVLGFIIEQDGTVTDVSVKRSVNYLLDNEAVRVVKQFPKFKPGRQQGKDVKVAFVLPIMFKLAPAEPAKDNKPIKRPPPQY